jgi:hypothetical protein
VSEDDSRSGDEVRIADLAKAFAHRGELLPTTTDEVARLEDEGIEDEVELPPSLSRPLGPRAEATTGRADVKTADAAPEPGSAKVVRLDEARRRSAPRGSLWTHVATFGVGAAVAAGAMLALRTPPSEAPVHEPQGGPATSTSAPKPSPSARVAIGPLSRCKAECCAGSACGAAQGELRSCASGRSCIACSEVGDDAFRLRVGAFSPTDHFHDDHPETLDVCSRVGAGPWQCLPLRGEAGATAEARSFSTPVSGAELAAGLEVELRHRGESAALGHYRDSVRVSSTTLCRGVGALVVDAHDEHLGSLALYLDETHYVELGRSDDALALSEVRRAFEASDPPPAIVETTAGGASRFALVLGPLDKARAEEIRWLLLEAGRSARVETGADYVGAPKPLP